MNIGKISTLVAVTLPVQSLVASGADAIVPLNTTIAQHAGGFNLARMEGSLPEVGMLTIEERPDKWTRSMAKRFSTLAAKEALDDLGDEEAEELESLAKLRRELHHPRSVDEILYSLKQRQVTQKLVSALEEYVSFHEAAQSR